MFSLHSIRPSLSGNQILPFNFIIIFVIVLASSQIFAQTPTLCEAYGQEPFNADIIINGPPPNSPIITNTSSLGVTGWSNKKVLIYGTLNINSLFAINNCTIKMHSSAKIQIESDFTTTFSFNRIFNCGFIWKGITIKPDSKGLVLLSFNRIEDAEAAVRIESSNAKINFYANNFNRNLVGVSANNIPVNALFTSNLFNRSSNCNWSDGQFAFGPFGIELTGAAAVIGSTTNTTSGINKPNRYFNLISGINTSNSSATIGWSDFYNNKFGIRGGNSTFTISGKSKIDPTVFRHNKYDTYIYSTSLDITNSKFDFCNWENITSANNVIGFEVINIYGNTFNLFNHNYPDYEYYAAIDLERTSGTNPTSQIYRNIIEDNQINIEDFGHATVSAMRIRGFEGTEDKMLIKKNKIKVGAGGNEETSAFMQIVLGNAPGFVIENNDIISNNVGTTQNGYKNRMGFLLLNGNSSFNSASLYLNTVLSNEEEPDYLNNNPDPIDPEICAFHFINARSMDICSNITDNTLHGFHFLGDNDGTNFYYNKILNHSIGSPKPGYGFLMQPYVNSPNNFEGNLGLQTCYGNSFWLTDYTPGFGAKFDATNQDNIIANVFKVGFDDPSQMPFPRSPVGSGTAQDPFWFEEAACEDSPTPCINTKITDRITTRVTDYEQHIAQNNSQFITILNAEDWETKKLLVKKIIETPALASNTYLTDFYNAHLDESPGKFAQFESMLHSAIVIDSLQQIVTDNLVHDINNLLSKVDSLDNTLTDTLSILQADSTFFNYRGVLLHAIFLNNNLLINERNNIQSQRLTNLLDCEIFNNSLPSNEIYESNQKFLNYLEIKHAKGLPVDSNDLVQLRNIANQCPATTGRTRERALDWLPKNESLSYRSEFPYDIPCSRAQTDKVDESSSVSLTPNPATDQTLVRFSQPYFIEHIQVFDLSGREKIRFSPQIIQENIVIPTHQLNAGTYIVSIKNDHSVFQKKLIIVK